MKFFSLLCLSTIAVATPLGSRQSQPQGIDVSGFQPNVDFNQVKANGISFAFIKATEGTSKRSQEYVETYCNISRLAFRSDTFSNQYTGATNAGIIRGAYHFAHPDSSSGAAQANFFIDNGGGWTDDGITLPGASFKKPDNPNGPECYGLSASAMVSWAKDFSNTYKARTGRAPVIYSTTDWWTTCTGNSADFAENPLWIARFASSIGTLPAPVIASQPSGNLQTQDLIPATKTFSMVMPMA